MTGIPDPDDITAQVDDLLDPPAWPDADDREEEDRP